MVIEDNSHNSSTIQGWIDKWHPVAARAVQAFAPPFEGQLEDVQMAPLNGVTQHLDEYYRDYLSSMACRLRRPALLYPEHIAFSRKACRQDG